MKSLTEGDYRLRNHSHDHVWTATQQLAISIMSVDELLFLQMRHAAF